MAQSFQLCTELLHDCSNTLLRSQHLPTVQHVGAKGPILVDVAHDEARSPRELILPGSEALTDSYDLTTR